MKFLATDKICSIKFFFMSFTAILAIFRNKMFFLNWFLHDSRSDQVVNSLYLLFSVSIYSVCEGSRKIELLIEV